MIQCESSIRQSLQYVNTPGKKGLKNADLVCVLLMLGGHESIYTVNLRLKTCYRETKQITANKQK